MMSPGGRKRGEDFGGGVFQRRTSTNARFMRDVFSMNRLPQQRQQRDAPDDAFEAQMYALVLELEALEREATRERAARARRTPSACARSSAECGAR